MSECQSPFPRPEKLAVRWRYSSECCERHCTLRWVIFLLSHQIENKSQVIFPRSTHNIHDEIAIYAQFELQKTAYGFAYIFLTLGFIQNSVIVKLCEISTLSIGGKSIIRKIGGWWKRCATHLKLKGEARSEINRVDQQYRRYDFSFK